MNDYDDQRDYAEEAYNQALLAGESDYDDEQIITEVSHNADWASLGSEAAWNAAMRGFAQNN